jgi:hypothetical protein
MVFLKWHKQAGARGVKGTVSEHLGNVLAHSSVASTDAINSLEGDLSRVTAWKQFPRVTAE